MIIFDYLETENFDDYSSEIFTILCNNMSQIAPTGNTPEEDYKVWYEALKLGLQKVNRKIVLISLASNNKLIGFFQYYTDEDTFVMEEIQINPEYQCTNQIFRQLYAFVLPQIDKDLLFVEAYANKLNSKSCGILTRLGLKVIGENRSGKSFHYKGNYSELLNWYNCIH